MGSVLPEVSFDMEGEPDVFEPAEDEKDESAEMEEEIRTTADESAQDAARIYLRDIYKNKLLTAEEEIELATRIEHGDQAARAVMIVSNLRLVVKMTKRYLNRGLPFLDLIEEGNLGLIKAVDRFKVSKECRFSTYATWWIRQSIERALVNQSRTVRLPVHVSDRLGKMARATRELKGSLGREPTMQEIAAYLGMELSCVRGLLALLKKTLSLDQPMGEAAEFALSDTLVDTSNVPADLLFENLSLHELASQWFEVLSPTEKSILTLRFGLDDRNPQTLETIGRSLGVTRERIRQIESKALEKLRVHMADEAPLLIYQETEENFDIMPEEPALTAEKRHRKVPLS
jgi:RNA polymerase primary sigma factor